MATIRLKGIFTVRAKGKIYRYAWRGGPRLPGEPGSPEFMAAYSEAIESGRAPDASRFRALVVSYKKSRDYAKLADSTKRQWDRWLDRISDHFGSLRIAHFDMTSKIKPIIRRWRDDWGNTPRTADYGMQVLSRVLSHAVEHGKLASNPCEGIKALYKSDRSEIIWTEADIVRFKSANGCPKELADAVDLAACTGLRRGDLLRLSWTHVNDVSIVMTTGKSRHRREVLIPLYGELRSLLARIPKRATTVLTNTRGRPWTANGFNTAFQRAKERAAIGGELHFHDLRGTAATTFYKANLAVREIAEIMGWEEEHVARIIRKYVGRNAATKSLIARIDRTKGGT
jgi:integrase